MKFLFGFLRSLVENRASKEPDPATVESHHNSGVALHARHDYAAALASFERAVHAHPGYAEGWFNRGTALHALGRIEEACESYGKAIALRPAYVEAQFNLGVAQKEAGDLAAAVATLARGVQIDPDFPFLYGTWLEARLRACDWDALDAAFGGLKERIARGEKSATPQVVVMPLTAAEQKRAVALWASVKYPPRGSLPPISRRAPRERAHIGYFSADFHDHATSNLIAGLFERHDKSRFELTAFTFGPDKGDAMQTRVLAAFDRVVDVRSMPDAEAAAAARALGVEIAVDLKGFTSGARTGIFAERAAPIQVAYLGYPGTMGVGYMDYLLADRTLIPPGEEAHYAEKVARLPNSYQANDSARVIPQAESTRKDAGLPAEGFVFCCFNNNYKIVPQVFEAWMRILREVPGSVLWLLEDNPVAMRNLGREAARRGIDAARLVFARRVTQPEHLARQRLAGLFLDTLPCNAHTTASDALWAGVPLITLPGETFAGRVAASLLNAMRLPELVAASTEDYVRLAIEYAIDAERFQALKTKLAANRSTAPLFDTALFTRHIEAAYLAMLERHRIGLPPDHFDVPACPITISRKGVPMPNQNRQFKLAARPAGMVKRSDFEFNTAPAGEPGPGEVLIRVLYVSLDPAMRGWMNEGRSYIPPVGIGEVMRAGTAGKVIASNNPKFAVGDYVAGWGGVQDYVISKGDDITKVDPRLAPLPVYLGTLGMPGMTAYFGLLEVGKPKEGETVVVSGAAGAVGTVVGQVAKIKGCRVVGIAGGPDKCKWIVDELGFDAAIDYKAEDVNKALRQHCPKGVDVYFDNVGGDILDAALARMGRHGRIVICGAISQYNNTTPVKGPSNYLSLLVNRASMTGMVVMDYTEKFGGAVREMAGWMKAGKLKTHEHIVDGLETFPETLLMLFKGENTGKLLIKVADA